MCVNPRILKSVIVPIQRMPLSRMVFPNGKDGLCYCEGTITTKAPQEWLKKLYSELPSGIEGFFQVFSPAAVGGKRHLAWAAYSSHLAWKSHSMQAKKPEMELLCHLSGEKQIPEAQSRVGIKSGKQEIVVVFVGNLSSLPKTIFPALCKSLRIQSKKVKWGSAITPSKDWSRSIEDFAIEKSALFES